MCIYIHISLWAVVNLNSNRTSPVCTGLPDNSVYWLDPMVQYVALTKLTYDRGQFSWHSPVGQLPWRVKTFYSTWPNPRPIWPTPLAQSTVQPVFWIFYDQTCLLYTVRTPKIQSKALLKHQTHFSSKSINININVFLKVKLSIRNI